MIRRELKGRIQNAFIILIMGALVSIIPFYFNTTGAAQENQITNEKQDEVLRKHEFEIQQIRVNNAIEKTETEQIKEALKRIESKLDRLIEKEETLIN